MKQRQIIFTKVNISIILLIALILTFVNLSVKIYEKKNNMNEPIQNQNYNSMLSFIEVDENGNQKHLDNMPEGKNWNIEVICNNNAEAIWNYKNWKLEMKKMTNRAKCKLTFSPYHPPLEKYGINERVITTGNGLYEVIHDNANITSSLNTTEKQNLQKTEYRYAGYDPNNYVTFNEEEAGWRIIGLVNTPEGQRIKIIRDESIGAYSWDSSPSNINGGRGINEWSQADIMTLLNKGAYYNRTSGNCYHDSNNTTVPCDFSGFGLTSNAKSMIDTITWNTGSILESEITSNASKFYELERGNKTGKGCSSGTYCTDTITRTTLWKGQVGLIYPSDHSYATSGGPSTSRKVCLEQGQQSWIAGNQDDCGNNSWITTHWTLMSVNTSRDNSFGIYLSWGQNQPTVTNTKFPLYINPVVYLKTNVKVISGLGTEENPYNLST